MIIAAELCVVGMFLSLAIAYIAPLFTNRISLQNFIGQCGLAGELFFAFLGLIIAFISYIIGV